MSERTKLIVAVCGTVFGLGLLGVLFWRRGAEILSALDGVSAGALAILLGAQLVAYVARGEAWRRCILAAGYEVRTSLPQRASAPMYIANCFVPVYAGIWVRMAAVKRLSSNPPSVGQMIAADGVILFIELWITIVLVIAVIALTGIGLQWLIAGLVLLAATTALVIHSRRNLADKLFTQPLRVLSDAGHRLVLISSLVVAIGVQPLRFWVALESVGIDASLGQVLITFLGTSIFGALPFGQGPASVAAGSAVFGVSNIDLVAASALLISGSALASALLYTAAFNVKPLLKRIRRAESRNEELPAVRSRRTGTQES